MNKTTIIVVLAAVAILVLLAGCTGTMPAAAGSQPAGVQPAQLPAPVSLSQTPVQYKDVNGVRLAYWEWGSGEPVLLIEGFGGTVANATPAQAAWNETFLGILSSKYHVYAYDHRGMGYSSTNNATPTIHLYADDAAELIRALGYDSMNVYGESMGSSTAQQLVIDHPERVKKLILDSNTYDARVPECKSLLAILEKSAYDQNQTAGLRAEAQANLAWNGTWDGLSGIHKDVMLVVGTADLLTPQPVSVRMAGQINGSWLVRYKGLPHIGSRYAPVQYGETALFFLGTNETPTGIS
ncbi:MAG: alpha/beta hydrolase [Methanoregulaceae archaeon]